MWLFKKKIPTLRESGFLKGLTDWHSHILPGVDDGLQDMKDALNILEVYQNAGVKKVWLTPHIMEDFPNSTQSLKEKFRSLKNEWKGNVEIALASENMLDSLFEDRLEKDDFLTLGDTGKNLLVETSYYNAPYGMKSMLDEAIRKGYRIVLAHPERYRYMQTKDYIELKNKGVLFQLNFMSLTGAYGETSAKIAHKLLSERMIDIVGGDFHRVEHLKGQLDTPFLHKDIINRLNYVSNRI